MSQSNNSVVTPRSNGARGTRHYSSHRHNSRSRSRERRQYRSTHHRPSSIGGEESGGGDGNSHQSRDQPRWRSTSNHHHHHHHTPNSSRRPSLVEERQRLDPRDDRISHASHTQSQRRLPSPSPLPLSSSQQQPPRRLREVVLRGDVRHHSNNSNINNSVSRSNQDQPPPRHSSAASVVPLSSSPSSSSSSSSTQRPVELLDHVQPSARGRYAYVFLVMRGDSYAVGAMTCAYSLRLAGARHDLVCMVTPDVSEDCRRMMRLIFTNVVEVPYLSFRVAPLRTQKQRTMYGAWVTDAFTKWNCLSLVQYEKTLFVDADKLALANLDHLFEEMRAPAGTFSSPWSQPFVQKKEAAATRRANALKTSSASADTAASSSASVSHRHHTPQRSNSQGMVNPYQQCDHGSRVTRSMVHQGLTEHSFVVIGTMVLLSPNKEDLAQFKHMLTDMEPFGFSNCFSMMDEQSLSYYFAIHKNKLLASGAYGRLTASSSSSSLSSSVSSACMSEWSYIHHRYNYVPWHRYWLHGDEVPYVFHFFNTKPWVLDRASFLDLEAWWEVVQVLLADEITLPTIEQRTDMRKLFPEASLILPKVAGCAWCRVTAELEPPLEPPPPTSSSASATPHESPPPLWQDHNMFDPKGHIACRVLREGFAHEQQRRRVLHSA